MHKLLISLSKSTVSVYISPWTGQRYDTVFFLLSSTFWNFRFLIFKSIDTISRNNGIFEVEYQNGKAEITYKEDGDYDIALTPPAAARLLLAGEGHNKDTAVFIEGVELKNDAADFFRAFPHRITCLYDSLWST